MAKPDKQSKKTSSLLDDDEEEDRKPSKKLKPKKGKKKKAAEEPVVEKKKKKKKKRNLTDDLESAVGKQMANLDVELEEEDEVEEDLDLEEDDEDSVVEETEEEEEETEEETEETEEEEEEEEETEEETEEEELSPEEADAERDAQGLRVTITVAFERCTKCSHLVSHAEKRWDDCHYSNGNENCPAKTHYVIKGLPIEETAQLLVKAILSGDLRTASKIRRRLESKYDPLVSRMVNEAELRLMEAHYTRKALASVGLSAPKAEQQVDESERDTVIDEIALSLDTKTSEDSGISTVDEPVADASVVKVEEPQTATETAVSEVVKVPKVVAPATIAKTKKTVVKKKAVLPPTVPPAASADDGDI